MSFLLCLALQTPSVIYHLNSSIFHSLLLSDISENSYMNADTVINLHGFNIRSIESNTFMNYHVPVTTIILSSNALSHLPNKVFESFSGTLTNLNLQNNKFCSLKNNYFLHHLKRLHTLDLSKNQIKGICIEHFIGLKRLDTLILRENQITSLPYGSFSYCRKIRTLDLSDNNISMIDSNAFRLLNDLKILLLNNNPLGQRSSLKNHLLKPLKNLEYLDLENTQLKTLSPFLFISNHRLQSIKLRRNHFQMMFNNHSNSSLKRSFCGAKSLIEIDLVNTNIHSLDVCTYHQIPSLRRLYLMDNPLDCTCDLFYLKYGDLYRLLLDNENDLDQKNVNIDIYLNRWISRPELRRHLEDAYTRGDLYRLPIELSLFARCTTPQEWNGYELDNITDIYNRCRHRWFAIQQECQNYCQIEHYEDISSATVKLFSSSSIQYGFYIIVLFII